MFNNNKPGWRTVLGSSLVLSSIISAICGAAANVPLWVKLLMAVVEIAVLIAGMTLMHGEE